jgi:hypothetical protein
MLFINSFLIFSRENREFFLPTERERERGGEGEILEKFINKYIVLKLSILKLRCTLTCTMF